MGLFAGVWIEKTRFFTLLRCLDSPTSQLPPQKNMLASPSSIFWPTSITSPTSRPFEKYPALRVS